MSALVLCATIVVVVFGVLAVSGLIGGDAFGVALLKARDHVLRVKVWHLMVAVAATVALFILSENPPLLGVFAAFLTLVLFAWAWVHEFRFLMALGDDDFPGRFDKPIWAALMVLAPPVGLWVFRSYHLSCWPEPAATKPAAGPSHEPELSRP
jgi:hypothetical protein